jgi:hypothetical protein
MSSRLASRLRRSTSSHAVEALEVRILPTVTATLSRNTLMLTGDQTANDISLETVDGNLVIKGNGDTLISFGGETGSQFTIAGVQHLKGIFGQQADKISFENGLTLGNVTLQLGNGANEVEFQDANITGALVITGGAMADKVEFEASTLNSVTLNLVNGNDDVEFRGSTFNGAVSINTSNGQDDIQSEIGTGGVWNTFLGAVSINTGNQADKIEFRNAHFANLTIAAGADNDDIDLETIDATGVIKVDGSSGNDDIRLDGVNQTGTDLNTILGGSGIDVVKIKGSNFASAVSINNGSGNNNQLEIDDVVFSLATTIVSMGQSDDIKVEQDLSRAGRVEFRGALSVMMGPGGQLDIGVDNDSSYTDAQAAVTLKGTKPNLIATVFDSRGAFAVPPVLKNAEIVILAGA